MYQPFLSNSFNVLKFALLHQKTELNILIISFTPNKGKTNLDKISLIFFYRALLYNWFYAQRQTQGIYSPDSQSSSSQRTLYLEQLLHDCIWFFIRF